MNAGELWDVLSALACKVSASNPTVTFEKCCSIDFHKDTTKKFVRKQQGAAQTNVVLHCKWITVRKGILTGRKEEIPNLFFRLGRGIKFVHQLHGCLFLWRKTELLGKFLPLFHLFSPFAWEDSEYFEVGAGSLSMCLQCNDALVWCCTARSDGVNQCTFWKAEQFELVFFTVTQITKCCLCFVSSEWLEGVAKALPKQDWTLISWVGCAAPLWLSGAGFKSSSKMKDHNHFKQQVHERHLLTLQKHSWETTFLIFDSHIFCYWNCRAVRNCWQVNQICLLKNFTKAGFFCNIAFQ